MSAEYEWRYDNDDYIPTQGMRDAFGDMFDGLWSVAEAVIRGDGDERLSDLVEEYQHDIPALRQLYYKRLARRMNRRSRMILQNPQADVFGFETDVVFRENLAFIKDMETKKIRTCSSSEDMFRIICKGTRDDY